jgi:hypothetical protein
MKKRIEKTVVPSREERMEKIGDPKTPKMGKITPKKIEVPEVDDLLDKLKQAAPPPVVREVWNFPAQFVSFDLAAPVSGNRCNVNCQCAPCRRGDCGDCYVDRQRNSDRDTVRAFVAKYRGVDLP